MKLNVGSGQRKFGAGWTNVDTQSKWDPDVVADAKHMPMFADGSAEMIVLHQVLEHFWVEDAKAVIGECYRILQPGRSLIITVPNTRELAMRWLRGEIDTNLFLINTYGAYMGDQADLHRWAYIGQTLADMLLQCAAWRTVKSFDWRPIEQASIAYDWWVLGIEAIK